MPRALATWMSDAATSRTWLTLPAEPSTSALLIVCTESTMTQLGLERVDLAEHRREVGLAGEVERAGHRLDALGPGAHLRGGLLTADVEHPALAVLARAGGPGGDVEQQGGLADAGLAGHEHDGAGHDAAAEHPVELRHPGGAGDRPPGVDLTDRDRGRARPPSRPWCAR